MKPVPATVGKTTFSSSIGYRKQWEFLQTNCLLINAGMPSHKHEQILSPCFLRYTTLRTCSVSHPQIIEPVQKEIKDNISVSLTPKKGGNISLKRDVAMLPESV